MAASIGWELYRTFLAVLDAGSLSGAARELGLTQPTIGRHVSALEQALATTLFTRSHAGLLPTDAALALRGHVQAMSSTAASLERVAGELGAGVQGAVRISASEVIGVEVLPPILAALRRRHPRLVIELMLSNRIQDLVGREADLAIRMTTPKQEVLLATRVGDVVLGLHAHRSYLEHHGRPASLAALADHALVGFDHETPFLRSARPGGLPWQRERFALRCDSDVGQLALIRAGAGIGVCQAAVARRDPNLVRLLPDKLALKLSTWVVMHKDLRDSPRCRATYDALVTGLRAYTA